MFLFTWVFLFQILNYFLDSPCILRHEAYQLFALHVLPEKKKNSAFILGFKKGTSLPNQPKTKFNRNFNLCLQ